MESDDDINNNCFQISIINCETFITKKGYNKQMGKRIEQYQVQVISLIKIWAKNLRCLKCDSPF